MARAARVLFFIKRGPKPDYHQAPFHPYIICTRKGVATWEAGWTGDRTWLWSHEAADSGSGWLLERWEGLNIDYGHLVRGCSLPDGTHVGFYHKHRDLGYDPETKQRLGYAAELQEPWNLLPQAVWWSLDPIPEWLKDQGVMVPMDEFSRHRIIEDYSFADQQERKRDRPYPEAPEWWPDATS